MQLTPLRILSLILSVAGSLQGLSAKYGQDLVWPTPNTAYLERQSSETYLQATTSGRIESGEWGCSRNDGSKFHEGVDLKSIRKSQDGTATDPVAAIADGVVAHINRSVADSNYGLYIVISHQDLGLEWCSLYAHLSSISPEIRTGSRVKAGQTIGVIGNTSSSIQIPKANAHLHFEIALRLNSRFEIWYQQQGFDTPNEHGSWNGMNLQGINPFDFYDYFIENPEKPFYSFFLKEPVSYELLIFFEHRPDFLLRNPIFLRGKPAPNRGTWYNIGFTWYGLPIDWTAVDAERTDKRLNHEEIYIRNLRHEKPCRNWINETSKGLEPTNLLRNQIALLKAGN